MGPLDFIYFNSMLKAMLSAKLEQVASGLVWLSYLLKALKWVESCVWNLDKFGAKCPKVWKVTVLSSLNEACSSLVSWKLCFLSIFGVMMFVLQLCNSLQCAQYSNFQKIKGKQKNMLPLSIHIFLVDTKLKYFKSNISLSLTKNKKG